MVSVKNVQIMIIFPILLTLSPQSVCLQIVLALQVSRTFNKNLTEIYPLLCFSISVFILLSVTFSVISFSVVNSSRCRQLQFIFIFISINIPLSSIESQTLSLSLSSSLITFNLQLYQPFYLTQKNLSLIILIISKGIQNIWNYLLLDECMLGISM